MDRARARLTALVVGALGVALLVAAGFFMLASAAPGRPTLIVREQAWTAPGESLARDLTHAPGECLARRSADVEVGRALFRSPGLLGGPAARAGLSCQACHTNGRVNTRFFLAELTDRAGAADATSEWASKVRGDGVMNPRDIPDLVGAADRTAFGQARDPSLEHFVSGVIAEEFQGVTPPSEAFAGLMAYLRALRADACAAVEIQITLGLYADDVRRTLSAAEAADRGTAHLLLFAAQDGVGRIVERLPRSQFGSERRRFEALARELGSVRSAGTAPPALATVLPGWRARFDATLARVARRESETYFDEATLSDALVQ